MPDLLEHLYCAQQINIPPNLPYILKQYAKAAIRTQPYDLLYWSAAYFRAKANNSPPPVKERLEYPPFDSPSRLSPGFLRVLHKQLGTHDYVRVEVVYEKWLGVCLVREALDSMLKIGNVQHRIPWLRFVAIAAGHICTSLGKTMVLICEVLTDQPDGGAAWIPVEKFVELYEFLARLNCGPDPPHVKHAEFDVLTPSASTTQASSSHGSKESEPEEGDEKDSTAGLMVWPDIKPEKKKDRVRSPKYNEELGATSEHGIEVLDESKGTVTELVTLYPAAPGSTKTKTQISGRAVTVTSDVTKIGSQPPEVESSEGENILSHTSLKENEDWIKVEARDLYEEGRASEALDLDKLLASAQASKTDLTSQASRTNVPGTRTETKVKKEAEKDEEEGAEEELKVEEEDKIGQEPVESPAEQQEDATSKDMEEETSEKEKPLEEANEEEEEGEAEGEEGVSKEKVPEEGATSQGTLDSQQKSDSGVTVELKSTVDSSESEFALDPTITMTNFAGTNRQTGYSVVEIRKGRVGDKSLDQIDSNEGPYASPTVHRLTAESESTIETKEEDAKFQYWEHVPGIGPVIPDAQILAVVEYMQYWASKQEGLVGPRSITHLLCPPLDLPPADPEQEVIY